jgi:hypothetical protein
MANALTLHEFEIFESIQMIEFLSWPKKTRSEISVNIQTNIALSNHLAGWYGNLICFFILI